MKELTKLTHTYVSLYHLQVDFKLDIHWVIMAFYISSLDHYVTHHKMILQHRQAKTRRR